MSHPVVNRIGTEEGDAAADKEMLPPLVRHARFGFMLLARIFAVLILIQVFLAGLATFWNAEQWASHAGFSRLLIVPPADAYRLVHRSAASLFSSEQRGFDRHVHPDGRNRQTIVGCRIRIGSPPGTRTHDVYGCGIQRSKDRCTPKSKITAF